MSDAYLKVKDNGAQGLALVREDTDTSVSELKTQLNGIENNLEYYDPIIGSAIPMTNGRIIYYNNGLDSGANAGSYSGYIHIEGYTKIIYPRMKYSGDPGKPGIAFYREPNTGAGSYISGIASIKNQGVNTYDYVEADVPEEAKYMRISGFANMTDSLYIKDPINKKSKFIEDTENALDHAVKPELQIFTNLYNPADSDIETGQEINRNGVMSANVSFNVSGYIPCDVGEKYCFPMYTSHAGTGEAARSIPLYDENKNYLNYVVGTLSGTILTITIPASAKYFRVNLCAANANNNNIQTAFHSNANFMVVKGNTFPERFYPYNSQSYTDPDLYSGHENLDNPLYAKKVVFLGDSICQGDAESGWAGRIGNSNTMLWVNSGINGSTISTAEASKCICTRSIKISDPDYIIFEGGTNDADKIGSIIGGNIPAGFGSYSDDDYGTNDGDTYFGFDIDTYCGAFEYLCKRLITNYPGTKIGYIVAHKMGAGASGYTPTNNNRRAYFKTAMEICHKWGIPYINLWDECYLNPKIPALYTSGSEDSLYSDGQHLKAKGYEYISPIIAAWMKTL